MREKYFVRIGGTAVAGIVWTEPKGRAPGNVKVSGPRQNAEDARVIVSAFVKRKEEAKEEHAGRSHVRFKAEDVDLKRWDRGLKLMREWGWKLDKTRRLRRMTG